MQTIIGHVKNLELRELINKEKMYIYIEGKEPVSRKSKSLAEMGVNDGDNLIVTTEMKLPFDEISDSADEGAGYDVEVQCSQIQIQQITTKLLVKLILM